MPNISIREAPTWGIHIWVEGQEFAVAIQGTLGLPEPEQELEEKRAKFYPTYKVMDVIGVINVNRDKDEYWSGEDPGTAIGSHSQSGSTLLVTRGRGVKDSKNYI